MNSTINSFTILQLKQGDEDAFKYVFNKLSDSIYSMALRFLKDPSWSEEIVQEVFIKLWINKEGLDETGNLWSYLYVLTKRLCLNRMRDIKKSKETLELFTHYIENKSNITQDDIYVADLKRSLTAALSTLPSRQKLVFELSRNQGFSHKEIAQKLNISPNTVKNHMVAALRTIKKSINHPDSLILLIVFKLF